MKKPAFGSAQQISEARRLELLIDALSDHAIFMLDEAGFVTSWNAGAERIKGYTAREAIGQHFSRFGTIEDQRDRLPERILAHARAFGRNDSEGWRVRKNGEHRSVQRDAHEHRSGQRDHHQGVPDGRQVVDRRQLAEGGGGPVVSGRREP